MRVKQAAAEGEARWQTAARPNRRGARRTSRWARAARDDGGARRASSRAWRLVERDGARFNDALAQRTVTGHEEAVVRRGRVDAHDVQSGSVHDLDAAAFVHDERCDVVPETIMVAGDERDAPALEPGGEGVAEARVLGGATAMREVAGDDQVIDRGGEQALAQRRRVQIRCAVTADMEVGEMRQGLRLHMSTLRASCEVPPTGVQHIDHEYSSAWSTAGLRCATTTRSAPFTGPIQSVALIPESRAYASHRSRRRGSRALPRCRHHALGARRGEAERGCRVSREGGGAEGTPGARHRDLADAGG